MIRGQGSISIRHEQDSDGRNVEGVAVPYGVPVRGPTQEYGSATETFTRGAFEQYVAGGGRLALLDRHDGTVVGMATAAETDQGLAYRGRLLDSQPARDYAERVAAGMDSVSIEFTPGVVKRSRGAVTHVAGAIAHGIAGTYRPAYQGATVALREGIPMVDTIETTDDTAAAGASPATLPAPAGLDESRVQAIARTVTLGELERAQRSWAEMRAGQAPDAGPWAGVRTLGELVVRGFLVPKGDPILDWGSQAYAARALANQLTTDSPGVTTPGVSGEVRGLIDNGRPVIASFGRDTPGGTGLTVSWPYTTVDIETLVAKQATEKTEVTSVKVPILRATANLETYAGGSDISYQLIRRSDPAYLAIYARYMLAGWAAVTDKAAATQLLATVGIITGPALPSAAGAADPAAVRAAIFQASVLVENATGSPAEFVLAGDAVFSAIGAAMFPAPVLNTSGTASANTLRVEVSDLPVRHARHIPGNTAVVSNTLAASWLEEGPFQAVAEDVAHLGRDEAIWSMGILAPYMPTGIVKLVQLP